jgi:lipoprotein-anchoring transpeptidase ErfK/SrfK
VETIKTAVVILILLGILYGVYVVLNKPEPTPPPEAAWQTEELAPPQVSLGDPPGLTTPVSPEDRGRENAPSLAPQDVAATGDPTDSPSAVGHLDDTSADHRRPLAAAGGGVAPPSRLPLQEYPAHLDDNSTTLPSATERAGGSRTIATPVANVRDIAEPGTEGAEPAPRSLRPNDSRDPPPARVFDDVWRSALAQVQRQEFAEALLTLSLFYGDPYLTGEERQRLVDLLDPLAGRVIYSAEHTLERPHEVRPGQTLFDVAEQYRVPAILLQNINGVADPRVLQPGSKIKVVRGPFRAEVDVANSELVLFLGKYYAGRFPVSIGNDPAPKPATYEVRAKEEGREYRAPNGARIPPRAPDNPYGNVWLDLGGNMAIHGSPETPSAHGSLGCISLTAVDVADVFGILNVGSRVLVR